MVFHDFLDRFEATWGVSESRSKHGGHGALLLPSVLLLLALSGGPLGSPWSLAP